MGMCTILMKATCMHTGMHVRMHAHVQGARHDGEGGVHGAGVEDGRAQVAARGQRLERPARGIGVCAHLGTGYYSTTTHNIHT